MLNQINSISQEQLENIKFRVVATNGTPVNNASVSITGGQEPISFISGSSGESVYYYIQQGTLLNVSIPASGIYEALDTSLTVSFEIGVIELTLSSSDEVLNSESPIVFASTSKTIAQLQANGLSILDEDPFNQYVRDEAKQVSTFYIAPGDNFRLLLNFDTGDIENYSISILDCQYKVIAASVGTVKIIADGTNQAYYLDFVAPDLDDQFTRIAIYDPSGNPIFVGLTGIGFITDKATYPLMRWRNDTDEFLFNYEYDTTFYNQMRAQIIKLEPSHEFEVEKARVLTTGRVINRNFTHDKTFEFEFYKLDDCGHDAMSLIVSSDQFFINEKRYEMADGYDINFNFRRNTNSAIAKMYDVGFSERSRS